MTEEGFTLGPSRRPNLSRDWSVFRTFKRTLFLGGYIVTPLLTKRIRVSNILTYLLEKTDVPIYKRSWYQF